MIDSKSEGNVMTPAYIAKLGLKIWPTNIEAQKIDGSSLKTFKIGIARF